MKKLPTVFPVPYGQLTGAQKRKVREIYTNQQGGKCQFCKNSLDGDPTEKVINLDFQEKMFPQGFLNNPVHLHHDHGTGLTIGAVHARCNAYLFQEYGE